jgi:type I restriction enzyme S subunit
MTRIGQLGKVVAGGTPSTEDVTNFDGNISWLTPADLSGYKLKYIERGKRNLTKKGLDSSSAVLMPAGSVLFTSRAPIGYVVLPQMELDIPGSSGSG